MVKREAEQRDKRRWEDKIKFNDSQEQTKVEVANKGIITADDEKLSEIEVDLIKAKGAKIGKYLKDKIPSHLSIKSKYLILLSVFI